MCRGLYRAWKSLIQSSEEEDAEEDGDEEREVIVFFLLQNLGLLSLRCGSLMARVMLLILKPSST